LFLYTTGGGKDDLESSTNFLLPKCRSAKRNQSRPFSSYAKLNKTNPVLSDPSCSKHTDILTHREILDLFHTKTQQKRERFL